MRVFAIVGRPNVGKSTLFNRLLGRYRAIVHDQPGVTRDWQSYTTVFQGLSLTLYDTPGLEDSQPVPHLTQQPQAWLWIVDGPQGMTSTDYHMARLLRKQPWPVIMVANKCERETSHQTVMAEFSALGWGPPVMISAKHGLGMNDLAQAMIAAVPAVTREDEVDPEASSSSISLDSPNPAIIVTVIGRPNVGKSTLINRFLGYERMKTGPQAGITTDAVSTSMTWKGHLLTLVDTAGLRRKTALRDTVENLASRETHRALIFTHVALVVLDASAGIDKQDLVLVDEAWQEGRGVIVVLNKWDRVTQPHLFLRHLPPSISRHVICPVSGLTGTGIHDLWNKVLEVYHLWNRRLPTGPLNRWLMQQISANPPPMIHGHRIKIKYMTQTKTRPPTFAVFGNRVKELSASYQRYLINRLMQDFSLPSARLVLMNTNNPYHQTDANG